MTPLLFKNALLINEGLITATDVMVRNGRIEKIAAHIDVPFKAEEIDCTGLHLMPGIIDDQVHFREPGLTHKAEIFTESRAAVAGGTTSFMEMPNTNPPAITLDLLEEKYAIASRRSIANYSFFMGTSPDNLDQLLRVDKRNVCGIKIFMGSSTGNMLVDDPQVLERIFAQCDHLIATHCEDDRLVKQRLEEAKAKYGNDIPVEMHPVIRNEEVCYRSSSMAVALAKKHGTRLHILHISTRDELPLFSNDMPLRNKKITAEACVHHLWFDSRDYERLGSRIKCNPAIKGPEHKSEILTAVLNDTIDIIATDHAPHTSDEKNQPYALSPSGLPLVQHSLNVMLAFYRSGKISLEKIVEKMCHAPAECFRISERGYVREGYHADLVLVDVAEKWMVERSQLLYKCGWSPFEGQQFTGRVKRTFVNGNCVFADGKILEGTTGSRMTFEA